MKKQKESKLKPCCARLLKDIMEHYDFIKKNNKVAERDWYDAVESKKRWEHNLH